MFGDHFYHETIKRSVSVFGTLFNNISIKRADGTMMKVPLAYGPRQKWIARLQQQAELGLGGTPRTSMDITERTCKSVFTVRPTTLGSLS